MEDEEADDPEAVNYPKNDVYFRLILVFAAILIFIQAVNIIRTYRCVAFYRLSMTWHPRATLVSQSVSD